MKYLDEFADPVLARRLLDDIAATVTRPWAMMEVCGGQTHTIIRNGIDQLLPPGVEMIHGPGCPVCVTPLETIDRALAIAARPEVIFCSFGDMLRVPGSADDLLRVKSRGGDVRVVYSPLDAVRVAQAHPDKQVVFFGIGFETTAPANAMTVLMADRLGVANFSLLASHVLVPPAIRAIMDSPSCRVQGFLAAGHVCTVMGMSQYQPLVDQYRVPIVVTGFEPLDVLEGIRRVLIQLEQGRAELDNAYPRAVSAEGNTQAQKVVADVFTVTDRNWRGIGMIPASGWRLADRWAEYDAERRFDVGGITTAESARCRSGEVLQGLIKPAQCEAFGTECTPRNPLGAPMVSSEGACAAYYQFRRLQTPSAAS
ncbi:MAG: hydrogenase formation protein HypD [Streptosporangiaceae bacterium]